MVKNPNFIVSLIILKAFVCVAQMAGEGRWQIPANWLGEYLFNNKHDEYNITVVHRAIYSVYTFLR